MQGKIELLIITIMSAATGTVAPLGAKLTPLEIPLIVIQIFQLVSYSVAIIVGLVTLYKFCKTK